MEQCKIYRLLYGHNLEARITKMDVDLHILLTGGCLPHIGAVSIFKAGKEESFIQLPGHKDGVIGNRWAKELSEIFPFRVTVVCGIHYDDASGSMIKEILRQTEEMFYETLEYLRQ